MEYLEAWGTRIHEKNLKSKFSCQTPFNKGPSRISHNFLFLVILIFGY